MTGLPPGLREAIRDILAFLQTHRTGRITLDAKDGDVLAWGFRRGRRGRRRKLTPPRPAA